MRLRFRPPWIVAGPAVLLLMTPPSAFGQTGTGVTCIPVSERAGRAFGCFILATQAIGPLDSGQAFWHLSTFATRSAAEAAAGRVAKVDRCQKACPESSGPIACVARMKHPNARPARSLTGMQVTPVPV